jgi:hypothetical protein
MVTLWKITRVAAGNDDNRWVWEQTRNGSVVARSPNSFGCYEECVDNARARGYTPARPKRTH